MFLSVARSTVPGMSSAQQQAPVEWLTLAEFAARRGDSDPTATGAWDASTRTTVAVVCRRRPNSAPDSMVTSSPGARSASW
jgi:hypothetical protein